MRCPECDHGNVPGSLFCERCGTDLQAAPPAPARIAPGEPAEPEETRRSCPACGHLNDPRFGFCEACGARLTGPSAPPPPPPPPAPAEPARRIESPVVEPPPEPAPPPPRAYEQSGQLATGPQRGKVKLTVEQGLVVGKQFLLNQDELLIGREDASDDVYPDVDLSGLDEGYVHRRHARLAFEGSFLFVTHLGGHNKTYVNNRPIADGLAHPLNIGDTLRVGKVLLRLVEA